MFVNSSEKAYIHYQNFIAVRNYLPAAITGTISVVTAAIVIVTVISVSTVVIAIVNSTLGSISFINQVHITEIPVVILATIAVTSIARVAGTGGTGLHIAVAVGAEDKGFLITEIETIVAALAGVAAMVGVSTRGSSDSHKGSESNENLHVGM